MTEPSTAAVTAMPAASSRIADRTAGPEAPEAAQQAAPADRMTTAVVAPACPSGAVICGPGARWGPMS